MRPPRPKLVAPASIAVVSVVIIVTPAADTVRLRDVSGNREAGDGVAEDRLILVETEPSFAALLRARFPRARVLETDARMVPARLASEGIPISAVLSGMPILSWRARQRLRFVLACLRLTGQGPFVQFTYFPGSPVPIAGRGLRARVTPTIWCNLWPARVWTYRLGDALALSHA